MERLVKFGCGSHRRSNGENCKNGSHSRTAVSAGVYAFLIAFPGGENYQCERASAIEILCGVLIRLGNLILQQSPPWRGALKAPDPSAFLRKTNRPFWHLYC